MDRSSEERSAGRGALQLPKHRQDSPAEGGPDDGTPPSDMSLERFREADRNTRLAKPTGSTTGFHIRVDLEPPVVDRESHENPSGRQDKTSPHDPTRAAAEFLNFQT